MTSLCEDLVRAEQQVLLAVLTRDEKALEGFSREWSQLLGLTKTIQSKGELDDKTALLFFHVSRAIENIAGCMLQSEAMLRDAQFDLMGDLIHEVPPNSPLAASSASYDIPAHLLFSHMPSTTVDTLGRHGALDTHAYRWLIQNIHNPYPTPTQLQTLGDLSKTSAAQVVLWFEEARDSIEWTRVSHEFFAGSPDATVSAAKRVYLEGDKAMPFDIVFAFTAVKAFAETLFSKRPALQEEFSCTDMVRSFQTEAQRGCPKPLDGSTTVSGETLVSPQASSTTLYDNFSLFTDGNEGEEEDITPPLPAAGVKRRHTEAELPSLSLGSERPTKRYRIRPAAEIRHHKSGWTSSLFRTPAVSVEGATTTSETQTSLIPPTPTSLFSNSQYSSPTSPLRKRKIAELDGNVLEEAASSYSILSSHTCKRRVSEDALVVSGELRCSSTIPPIDHSTPRLTQVSICPDTAVNLNVFDWNTISNCPVETTMSMPQPVSVYVPGSELVNIDPKGPDSQDFGHYMKAGHHPPFFGLCSLDELSALLQFPVESTRHSDPLTTPSIPPYLETPSLPLLDHDWSTIAEFMEQVPLTSARSTPQYSPATMFSVPSTSDIATGLLSSSSSQSTIQPISLLDQTTPPSVFLPLQPGAFTGNEYDMLSWFCNGL